MTDFIRVPPPDVAAIDPSTGKWVADYYDLIKRLDQLQPLSDIPADPTFSVTGVTPGSTSSTVTSSALSVNNLGATGVVHSYMGVNTSAAVQAQADSFSTAVSANNALFTDMQSAQAAISGISGRVTALENKINAIISDLHARFP